MGDTEEQLRAQAAKDEGTGIYEEGLNYDFQYGVLCHPVALKMANKGKITFVVTPGLHSLLSQVTRGWPVPANTMTNPLPAAKTDNMYFTCSLQSSDFC